MKEKQGLLDMWVKCRSKNASLARCPAENKLRDITVQVISWKEDMQAYEEAARDFLASCNTNPSSRSLQANVIFQGRVRYLSLLTKLADQFAVVRKLIAGTLKTRKNARKVEAIVKCGIFAEFFANPNSIDSVYDEVVEDLRFQQDKQEKQFPDDVYTFSQLVDVLDLFVRFPVLTMARS